MPTIYYDSVNYSIVGIHDKVYCYSYHKAIAVWIRGEDKIRVISANIGTQTNIKHQKLFIKWVKENKGGK